MQLNVFHGQFELFPPILNCELLLENASYVTNDAFSFLIPKFPKAPPN